IANGVHPDRVMLGFACDVLGEEGTKTIDAGEDFAALRVAAGPKPFCQLNANGRSSPKMWASALYMGMLLNCNTESGAPLMRKYLPTIIRMNEAGWQPITHARSSDPNIGIERWGTGESEKSLLFSVMNLAKAQATADISIDAKALSLKTPVHIKDDISGESLTAHEDNGKVKITLPLAGESTAAIRVSMD
ncbi:MAG TPA: hypothetical protein VL282_00005, partial [Tepidisphaeraceae bacterium]|nr:hypothetical protein [Tepidisphaeraceae bacterium]